MILYKKNVLLRFAALENVSVHCLRVVRLTIYNTIGNKYQWHSQDYAIRGGGGGMVMYELNY